jgi:hypothetical protein
MHFCQGCWWEGTGTELYEWDKVAPVGGEGKCPKCGGDLKLERPASGLATVEEVAGAMSEFTNDRGLVGGDAWRRVDDLFGRMPDFIGVWRAIGLCEGESLDEDNLGLCWAWEKGAAEAYGRPQEAGNIVVMHGEVAKDDVDWPTTFALNILLPNEKEIRLKPGTDIELLDVDGRKVNRLVTATTSRRRPRATSPTRSGSRS